MLSLFKKSTKTFYPILNCIKPYHSFGNKKQLDDYEAAIDQVKGYNYFNIHNIHNINQIRQVPKESIKFPSFIEPFQLSIDFLNKNQKQCQCSSKSLLLPCPHCVSN